MSIKDSGFVQLGAFQDGDHNWLAAQSLLLNFQIMPKELIIQTNDQFENQNKQTPFSYDLFGLVNNDDISDLNISVIAPVEDGNLTHPTPYGMYG